MVAIFNSLSRNSQGSPAFDSGEGPLPASGLTYVSGLPIDTLGRVYANDTGTVTYFQNGVPYDEDNRVCIAVDGTFNFFSTGGMPMTEDNQIIVSSGPQSISGYNNGVAMTGTGSVSIEFNENTILGGTAFSSGFSNGFEV